MEIQVKGHSGCHIEVVNEENGIYVYKSTSDSRFISRLSLQAQKQKAAANIEHPHIRVPKIYEIQENFGTTTIKMQYVYSKNFIEFFEQAGFEQIEYFIDALKSFIEYEISQCSLQKIPVKVFQNKFADISKRMACSPVYRGFCDINVEKTSLKADIDNVLARCQCFFDNMEDMTIPVGLCHGDLTFSNILFNGNNYYLIDFLDSFIETPLQDIVKIRQDTAFGWSQLMYTKPYDDVRLSLIFNKIDYEINSYFADKYQWYTDFYRPMQLMSILRILPYAHDKKVILYILRVLNALLADDRLESSILVEDYVNNEYPYRSINLQDKREPLSCGQRSLIMPIAADKPEYSHNLPPVFLIAEDGVMYCIRALKSLDLTKFEHIYITILKYLDEKYALTDRLALQLKVNGIENAEIVVLDEPTASQPETIYKTIQNKGIKGGIFVKDSDCSFTGECVYDNAVVIHPLEELERVIPKNKSYVNVDDMYYITNIIEKRIVSHYFTAGGYSFDDADTYCHYYERLSGTRGLYISHLIYSMLLDGYRFRPIFATSYEDFEFNF